VLIAIRITPVHRGDSNVVVWRSTTRRRGGGLPVREDRCAHHGRWVRGVEGGRLRNRHATRRWQPPIGGNLTARERSGWVRRGRV